MKPHLTFWGHRGLQPIERYLFSQKLLFLLAFRGVVLMAGHRIVSSSSRKTAGCAAGVRDMGFCVFWGFWLSVDELESEMFWMKPC